MFRRTETPLVTSSGRRCARPNPPTMPSLRSDNAPIRRTRREIQAHGARPRFPAQARAPAGGGIARRRLGARRRGHARLALDMRWMVVGDAGWDAAYFGAMFLMWLVMMIAMMLPSAAPAILTFAALPMQRRVGASAAFALGRAPRAHRPAAGLRVPAGGDRQRVDARDGRYPARPAIRSYEQFAGDPPAATQAWSA